MCGAAEPRRTLEFFGFHSADVSDLRSPIIRVRGLRAQLRNAMRPSAEDRPLPHVLISTSAVRLVVMKSRVRIRSRQEVDPFSACHILMFCHAPSRAAGLKLTPHSLGGSSVLLRESDLTAGPRSRGTPFSPGDWTGHAELGTMGLFHFGQKPREAAESSEDISESPPEEAHVRCV